MSKLRLGIIGFGNMGSSHARNLKAGKVENMVIGAICDISPARRAAAKELYPDVPVFENATDMFKSGTCDVVIIATYHYSHPTLAIEAFEQNTAFTLLQRSLQAYIPSR